MIRTGQPRLIVNMPNWTTRPFRVEVASFSRWGLNNNISSTFYMARILGGTAARASAHFFKLDGAGAPARTTGWHKLEARISDNQVDYYVDNILFQNREPPAQ